MESDKTGREVPIGYFAEETGEINSQVTHSSRKQDVGIVTDFVGIASLAPKMVNRRSNQHRAMKNFIVKVS